MLSVFVFVFVLDTPPPHVRLLTPPLLTPATWANLTVSPFPPLAPATSELVRVLQGPAPRHRHLLSSEFPSDETTGVFTHHPHLFFFPPQPGGRKYIMESKFLKHGRVV